MERRKREKNKGNEEMRKKETIRDEGRGRKRRGIERVKE